MDERIRAWGVIASVTLIKTLVSRPVTSLLKVRDKYLVLFSMVIKGTT